MIRPATEAETRAPQREAPPRRLETPAPPAAASEVNIGAAERLTTGALGAAIAGFGLDWINRHRTTGGTVAGLAVASAGAALIWRAATGHCPGYQALGVRADDAAATTHPLARRIRITESVTIAGSPQQVYDAWHEFETLSLPMRHLEHVEVFNERESHWTVRGPRDRRVSWRAEIIDDRPGELIAWRSEPGSEIDAEGTIRFAHAPGERGTDLTVDLTYHPPAGAVGAAYAKFTGHDPRSQVREDLRRFKSRLEADEIPTTESQPRGRHCA